MLTKDKTRLQLFEDGVLINKDLPKWTNAKKRIQLKKEQEIKGKVPEEITQQTYYVDNGTSSAVVNPVNSSTAYITLTNNNEVMTPEDYRHGEFDKANFDEASKLGIKELTEFITKTGPDTIFGRNYNNTFSNSVVNITSGEADNSKKEEPKKGLLDRILSHFKKEQPTSVVYSMSVLDFFENIKLIGKGSAEVYKDRVQKYLTALHQATVTGQVALKERLAREMFVNKYEAELYANGLFYVVKEDQVVDFAKKTEKGIALLYLKNFSRPLPTKVVDKLVEADSLEVFDNYAVLCYDPDGIQKGETEAERYKRQDPILFGLIAGSNKLYYITDWVDEYCDLTLQDFVDTLKIDKKDLKMK